ncbi:glycosyltransferase domain-containing protein [Marinicella sp. W31]|uniref:glycosyltransferase domain-containing protein n=1 Tax=Marinicella sp. W31 TaxID=3023713 RepID=UPI003757787F
MSDKVQGRCAVYTAIIGGYDRIKIPTHQHEQLDFFCFSDDPETASQPWAHRKIPYQHNDKTRQARYLKLHPHLLFPDYEWSIWIDGSLSIVGNLEVLLDEVKKTGAFGVYAHAKRDCLYQAAANCIDKKKDDPRLIEQQMAHYQSVGFPEHQGLVASGVLVRQHHKTDIIDINEKWWQQIERFSRRDQLSFNYVCWREGFNYYAIPERIGDGRFFRRNPHNS